MLERAREIYRQSKKRQDNFWTEWISRPPAALVVMALESTPVTPNQVTFLSLLVFVLGAAVLVAERTWIGFLSAVCITQLSYVLDCADGQLARLKGLSSPVGGLLDFLMDEIKAFVLVASVTVRLHLLTGDARFLYLGVGGLVVVASGIALTTFMRRPEYLEATGAKSTSSARAVAAPRARSPLTVVEAVGSAALHYPSYIIFVALLDRLEAFLYVYLTAHFLYLGRASLIVLYKLGRSLPAQRRSDGAGSGRLS